MQLQDRSTPFHQHNNNTGHVNNATNEHATPLKPPRSLSQLADSLSKPAPWPIPGLLPPGLCLLAGQPQAGASLLALQLALSLACGIAALNRFSTELSHVLYLGFNQPLSTILSRSKRLLDGTPPPATFTWTDAWSAWDQGGVQELSSWLLEHPEIRLVVIDSLACLTLSRSGTTQKHRLFHQLNALGHQHNVAILLLHSLARVKPGKPFASIPCSPLLLEACSTLAVLDHDPGKASATLHLTGYQFSTQALPLTMTEHEGWRLGGAEEPLTPERILILQELHRARAPLSPTIIAEATHQDVATVTRLLASMLRAGHVSNIRTGQYIGIVEPPKAGTTTPRMAGTSPSNTDAHLGTPSSSTGLPGGMITLAQAGNASPTPPDNA